MAFEHYRLIVAAHLASIILAIGGAAYAQSASSGDDADSPHLAGDEPGYLDLGAGAFNIQNHNGVSPSGEGRLEYRYGEKFLGIGPAVGVLANTQGGVYGYIGMYGDIVWDRFVLTPLGGIGGYARGGSESLGGPFAFRLSVNLAYELDDHSRAGVQFAHISNAGIYADNPGDNELLLTYALPLQLPF